jgi:hypothetical protein
MNIQEEKAIDEETAKAEASLIIDEAMKLGVELPSLPLGVDDGQALERHG